MSSAIRIHPLIQKLKEAGLIPKECGRILIDFQLGDAVRIYYSSFDVKPVLDILSDYIEADVKMTGKYKSSEIPGVPPQEPMSDEPLTPQEFIRAVYKLFDMAPYEIRLGDLYTLIAQAKNNVAIPEPVHVSHPEVPLHVRPDPADGEDSSL